MKERKPIDPALRRYLDEVAAANGGPAKTVPEARQRMVTALETRDAIPGLPNDVETREAEIAPGLAARIYRPAGTSGPLPLLVYLHGGGWVIGSIATYHPFCCLLSRAAGILVASVEYRLAPEHPYPQAVEDALTALRWAAAQASKWGGDPARLAVGGDSSGANLAAVAANRFCAWPESPALRAQLLLFPVTDHPSAGHLSYSENAIGYGLEAEGMRWFWEHYAPGVAPDDPDASPLQAISLPTLPPTFVLTAEYDVLRDEGLAYAEKLKAAGVAVTHTHAPDMHHNFPVSPGTVGRFPQSSAAVAKIGTWLRATLAGNE